MDITSDIPLNVIVKGRRLGEVVEKFMSSWNDANEIGSKMGLTEEELLSRTIKCAAYRIYLMGVQDGMKGDAKKKDE